MTDEQFKQLMDKLEEIKRLAPAPVYIYQPYPVYQPNYQPQPNYWDHNRITCGYPQYLQGIGIGQSNSNWS